ncbi:MAG: hypothetical protein ACI4AM_00730 [Muribaculaceae bacterium]
MRKIAFLLLMACAAMASAADFAGLVFTDQSGATTSVALDGLRITFEGDKAVVTNNSGSVELSLSSLASMEFTTTLSTAVVAVEDEAVEVYTMTGVRVDAQASLAPGIYIVKSTRGVSKIVVR